MVLWAAALLVGLLLGLVGGGGGIVTVPALVYGGGLDPKQAVATSLAVVGLIAAVAAVMEFRAGRVKWQDALPFAVAGIIGTFFGAKVVSGLLSSSVQMLIFATIMVAAGLSMLRSALKEGRGQKGSVTTPTRRNAALLMVSGLGVGIVSGVVGIGGGFMIVPALVLFAGFDAKRAVPTSLAIIAVNSVGGVAGYFGKGLIVPDAFYLFSAVGMVGMVLGGQVRAKLPARVIKLVFAGLLLVMSVVVFFTRG